LKEINKLILVGTIPSIIILVVTSVASSGLQQFGENIADFFSKKEPFAQAQIAVPTNKPILEGDSFILTADGSYDPDGGNISYTWQQRNENGIYASPSKVETKESKVNFIAPNVINDEILYLELIVEDDEGSENNDNVTVTVKPHHQFKKQWGENNHFNGTVGIAAENIYGSVFVVDRDNDRIQKFDNDGDFITKWGGYGNGNGSFNNPSGIAVDPNWKRRYVFVADSGNDRIQKFEEWSGWIKTWGSFCDTGTNIGCKDPDDPLEGNGQFHYPTGVAVDKDGNVYVADTSNHRIQKFDNNGTFITKWGSVCILQFRDECVDPDGPGPLELGDGQFFDPRGIAVGKDGSVYVVDKKNSRIQKFDANGTFITKWNNTSDGKFDPEYIAIDSETERVYVTDVRYKRVDEFDANGTFIRKWGITTDGKNPLLENPAGIAVSPLDPYDIYVADAVTNRINIFGRQPG
jgi:DNA-binding beta-propeller fold protein YncE